MKKKTVWVLSIIICLVLLSAPLVFAQDDSQKLTLRTLTVDWYQYAGPGVKLQYRSFDNRPMILYLPLSFERKLYRFVEAPKSSGDYSSLPVLLVHMKGSDVVFVDIYTTYMMQKGKIAEFNQKDLENFKAVEKKGKIELIFH
jgi:hypothetical protein